MTMLFNPLLYHKVRPPYPEALFVAIGEVLVQQPGRPKMLEIGPGAGLATGPMLALGNPEIEAVEPNPTFIELLKDRFGDKIQVHEAAFEAVSWPNATFDAVYAANSFHWLDAGKRFEICHKLLRSEGWLILFWNYYLLDAVEIYAEVQKVYSKFSAPVLAYAVSQYMKMANRRLMVESSAYFDVREERRFLQRFTYTTEKYLQLLRTFPDHQHYPEEFFSALRLVLDDCGGEVVVQVPSQLLLVQKRS